MEGLCAYQKEQVNRKQRGDITYVNMLLNHEIGYFINCTTAIKLYELANGIYRYPIDESHN